MDSTRTKIPAIICGILLVTGVAIIFYPQITGRQLAQQPSTFEPYRTTITGTYVCLPHADTSGPQTLECAFGLHANDGRYYALDFAMSSQALLTVPVGTRISASGLVTPVENLSSNHWRKYPIKGIFSVTDSFQRL